MSQLYAQDGGLQGVQAAVGADHFVKILFLAAMNAEHLQALGNGSVIGCNHPSVTRATQIL